MRQPLRQFCGECVCHLGEALALLLAVAAVLVGVSLWRLHQGPVTLTLFEDEIAAALAAALGGEEARFSKAEIKWRADDRALSLALTDIEVRRADGAKVIDTPRVEAGISMFSALLGRMQVTRLTVEGGTFSVVNTRHHGWQAGFGRPSRIREQAAKMSELESSDTAALPTLSGLMAILRKPPPMAEKLREFSLRGVVFRVVDDNKGLRLITNDGNLRFVRDDDELSAALTARFDTLDTLVEISAVSDPDLDSTEVDGRLVGLSFATLGEWVELPSSIKGLSAPLDLQLDADISATGMINTANIDCQVEEGFWTFGEKSFAVRPSKARLTIDNQRGLILLDDLKIDTGLVAFSAKARLEGGLGAIMETEGGLIPFNASIQEFRAETQPFFEVPTEIDSVRVDGSLDWRALRLEFDALEISVRDVIAKLEGNAALIAQGDGRHLPEIVISGGVDGALGHRDVLDFWPVPLADGARRWIVSNLDRATIFGTKIDLNLLAEDIRNQSIPDERVSVGFRFRDADARIISTLDPIRNASGSAELKGNAFSLRLDDARLRKLALSDGTIDIPRLVPKGAMAEFSAVATGTAGDVLAFIDGPPLGYARAFGLDPKTIAGQGRIMVTIGRPMLENVPVEDMTFAVDGRFDGVSGPVAETGLRLQNAQVAIVADEAHLQADITGMLGPSGARIVWEERFRDREIRPPSTFSIETEVTRDTLDAFALPSRNFFSGRFPVVLKGTGTGFDIAEAEVTADLTQAGIVIPGSYQKAVGEHASARFTVAPGPEPARGYLFTDVTAKAPGLAFSGRARVDQSGRLMSAAIDSMAVGDSFLAAIIIDPLEGNGLSVDLEAERADLRGILPGFLQGADGFGVPIELAAEIARARFTDAVDLTNVAVDLSHTGKGLSELVLSATGPSGPISATVAPSLDDPAVRNFEVRTSDADLILGSALAMRQVRGGQLQLSGTLRQMVQDRDEAPRQLIEGEAEMINFSVVGAPTMARMLTLGSLRGLADALGGEGIYFNRLKAPFRIEGATVIIDDAQATGPALGITVSGDFSLKDEEVDLQGVLVPAYSVNSVLGSVPILGDLLVSRTGEGVFALTYSVQGPFNATRVFVNPLSALAPGLFRRLFEGVPSTAPVQPTPKNAVPDAGD
jgi:hypothetical protein